MDTPAYDPASRTPMPTAPGTANGDFGGGNGYGWWAWSDTSKNWIWVDLYANEKKGYDATGPHIPTGSGNYPQMPKPTYNANYAGGPTPQTGKQMEIPGAFGAPNYTAFSLQRGQQGNQATTGAFGGPRSDTLVPQLEQVRMQRFMQAYPQFGGR